MTETQESAVTPAAVNQEQGKSVGEGVTQALLDAISLLDALPNAVFVKDEQLRFVFVNKEYEHIFGVKRSDIIGKTVTDLEYLSEDAREFYQLEDREMLQHGKVSHHIFQYKFTDGQTHRCLYWSGGFSQPNGLRGLIGSIVDITRQSEVICNLRRKVEYVTLEKKLAEEKSFTDSLTTLRNRGFFDDALRKMVGGGAEVFSCIIIDIDHFKDVNDTFGHQIGDAALRNVAGVIRACSRASDIVCRYGGEEFSILLPASDKKTAVMAADRIRAAVASQVFRPDGKPVTISAGCAEYKPGEAVLRLLERADVALYKAKNSGRNQVCA
ncbi:MAG: GGDEF domain-containing protein [Desulfovibrio sp.]|nr:GGDEF domain-containing protein [Desulfovibrio sp.]